MEQIDSLDINYEMKNIYSNHKSNHMKNSEWDSLSILSTLVINVN